MTKEKNKNELMEILNEKAIRRLGKDFSRYIRDIPAKCNLYGYQWEGTIFKKYRDRLDAVIAEYRDEMKRLGFDADRMTHEKIGRAMAKLYPENLEVVKGRVFTDLENIIVTVFNRDD